MGFGPGSKQTAEFALKRMGEREYHTVPTKSPPLRSYGQVPPARHSRESLVLAGHFAARETSRPKRIRHCVAPLFAMSARPKP